MLQRLKTYLTDTRAEMRRVTWPSRQETVRATLAVIAISVGVAAYLGVLDLIFNYLLTRFIL
mgnify:CR=1 FL=1